MPNAHIAEVILTPTSDMEESSDDPRTELDCHANMVVLGSISFVFESTGRTYNVQPFTSDLGVAKNVPVVDGSLAYDCPYTGEVYVLVLRNALHVTSMDHNLIPPFIMRAGSVTINDVPKMHCEDPIADDHSIFFEHSDPRIPLQLNSEFSYFHTREPTERQLHGCEKLFLTPYSSDWNPHCQSYERNEQSMLGFEGNISEPSRRSNNRVVLENENDDVMSELASTMASVTTSDWKDNIDSNASTAFAMPPSSDHYLNPSSDVDFCKAINLRGEISKRSASIGICNVSSEPCSVLDIGKPSFSKWEEVQSSLELVLNPEELEYIEAKVSSAQASRSRGVSKEFLSKLWLVPEHLAESAIERNTQIRRKSKDNPLSRNYTTNDRMLRHKRLQSVFFTDTMLASKHKSAKGNKCCQVFVSDKGYIDVYPMKSQDEFETALNWFCKEVGVSVNLILDGFSAQTK